MSKDIVLKDETYALGNGIEMIYFNSISKSIVNIQISFKDKDYKDDFMSIYLGKIKPFMFWGLGSNSDDYIIFECHSKFVDAIFHLVNEY